MIFLKKYKNIILVSFIFILGLALLLVNSNQNIKTNDNQFEYIEKIEKKLEDFLLNINGIHKVNVIITLEGSSNSSHNASENEQINVKGVAIACTNGENMTIKEKLTKIVSAYFDIPTNKIEIVGIN